MALTRTSVAAVALLLGVLPARAPAQGQLVYGMAEKGKVSVNGTVLDSMPSGFDEDTDAKTSERWQRLVVAGADRYALRLDGKLYKNGKSLYNLPFGVVVTPSGSFVFQWIGLDHGAAGIYALRADGQLSLNGVTVITLPRGDFSFSDCLAVDTGETTSNIYCLRSDGAVFLNTITTNPDHKFTGGPGLHVAGQNSSNTALDGAGTETVWVDLAWDPATQTLRGLRRDGKVSSGAEVVTPPAVQPLDPDLMALPYPSDFSGVASEAAQNANRYRSLGFTASGAWLAVRGNGQIYSPASLAEPLVDLPGEAGNIENTYVDVATIGEDFWTIRWDGRFYFNLETDSVADLTGSRYRQIEVSDVPPDLSNFKNPTPLLSAYQVTVVEGKPFSVPVYAVDIEKTGTDLTVSLQDPLKKPLPPGLTFTPTPELDPRVLPTVSWDAPTPKGSYSVPLVVSDGVNKPKTYTYKVKVILPDVNPLKNKKPTFTKVKSPQALGGFPYELEVFAVDADVDAIDPLQQEAVTLSVDLTKEPFLTLGAEFVADPGTGMGTFRWTPAFENIGKHKVKVIATDPTGATSSYTISIKVVNSLIFETPEP